MKINNFKFKFEIFKCFDVICHFQSLLKGLCWQKKINDKCQIQIN